MPWIVYMLRCRDGSLYTGATNDLGRRLELHRNGRGAAYTRGRAPLDVVYQEVVADRSAALRREWSLKRLSRVEKDQLIMGRDNLPTQSEFRGFGPSLMGFFGRLKRNNNREWFLANRPTYELHVKAPLQALIEEMDVRFARFAPEFVGDPRLSMFRIYRDVRFSKDKSPYKTHAACWFFHRDAGKGVGSEAHGGAGFYLHLAPEGSFLGAGIWMPPRPVLQKLRDAIADDQRGFERTILAPAMKRRFGTLDEEAVLKRPPRGFEPDHPASRWLRFQSFTMGRSIPRTQVLSRQLPKTLEGDYRRLLPFVRWLNGAIGYGALERRM